MLDGRQIAVIADATAGDTESALALLDETEPGEPWENAVTACLTIECRRGSGTTSLGTLLDHYRALNTSGPTLAVFQTRLGLSFVDALDIADDPLTRPIATDLINRAAASHDGYVARDILTHRGCHDLLTETQERTLTDLVEACALDHGTFPAALLTDLTTALASAEMVIERRTTSAEHCAQHTDRGTKCAD
jgi:hypothetical protein